MEFCAHLLRENNPNTCSNVALIFNRDVHFMVYLLREDLGAAPQILLEGLNVPSGLGTPWDPLGGAMKCPKGIFSFTAARSVVEWIIPVVEG